MSKYTPEQVEAMAEGLDVVGKCAAFGNVTPADGDQLFATAAMIRALQSALAASQEENALLLEVEKAGERLADTFDMVDPLVQEFFAWAQEHGHHPPPLQYVVLKMYAEDTSTALSNLHQYREGAEHEEASMGS